MRRDISFLTKRNVCSCWCSVGIQLCRCCLSWCGVLSCLVLRIFLCRVGGITKRLLQRLLKWLFLLRSGSFLFRSTLIANLSWNVHASLQVMLKRNDGVLTHDTRRCGTRSPGCHCVHWHTLVSGRGGPTMGTSKTCIEKKNLAEISHVLLHSGRKLSTDFTGIDDQNLEKFSRKHVRVLVHMSNQTGALRLQGQHTSNLKSFYSSWSMLLIQAETA